MFVPCFDFVLFVLFVGVALLSDDAHCIREEPPCYVVLCCTRYASFPFPCVCGTTAVFATEQVGGQAGADKLLKAMERRGRYCVEAWS